jgi:serine protease Do
MQTKVTILRDKREMEVMLRVGDLEKLEGLARAQSGNELLGMTVEKVTSDVARSLGLKNATGVIITEVTPNSPADSVGLEPGDIVFRVGNKVVEDPEKFNDLIASAVDDKEVMLLLRDGRSGRVGYIVVPLG